MGSYPYSFDRVALVYDETRQLPAAAQRGLLRTLCDELRNQRTLEIGVGTGRIARPLQAKGVDVVGIDVSPAMLAVGRRQGLDHVALADACHLPFRGRTFESTLMNHVLHLLADWPTALLEVRRVTRDRLLSVVERYRSDPDLDEEYNTLVEHRGVDLKLPGIGERVLAERLSPDHVRSIGTFSDTESAAVLIDRMQHRMFARLWNVPEDVHGEAIAHLHGQHRSELVESTLTLELVSWSVERLSSLSASGAGPVHPAPDSTDGGSTR